MKLNLDIKKMKKEGWVTHEEILVDFKKSAEFRRHQKENKPRRDLIGGIIKNRIKENFTQQELADIVGMKQSAIARIESGNANPRLSTIQKIADGLGKSLSITLK